jgi:PIN domain nuclease of toxin-antitoxin system
MIQGNPSVYVSVASLWEIAIKHALSRGRATDMPVSAAIAHDLFLASRFHLLPVAPEHALAVAELPYARTDPFDRMLLAQARREPLRLLTMDRRLAAFGDGVELI